MSQRFAIGLPALAFFIWTLASCSALGNGLTAANLSIGIPPLEQNALMYVAQDQKFFASQGLTVSFRNYESGPAAIDGMLKSEVDLAETAEFPFVRAVFDKEPVSIIATNDKFENDYILARSDRGIEKIADLKGKRIGVTRRTINEFYLGRLLDLHGIMLQDVAIVDLKPAEFVDAITKGDVDAVIAWQPYVHQARSAGGDSLVVWPAQSNQAVFGILVSTLDWPAAHKETLNRFLRALSQAQDYVARNPEQAKQIVKRQLNYDDSYMASIWPQHHFTLSLDFSLLVAMNDEAHWLINNNQTPERLVPDWLDHLYLGGLQAVDSSAVNIVR